MDKLLEFAKEMSSRNPLSSLRRNLEGITEATEKLNRATRALRAPSESITEAIDPHSRPARSGR